MAPVARPGHRVALVAYVVLIAVLASAASALPASAATLAGHEEAFVAEINRVRADSGLPALDVDVQLTRVARDWAAVMAERDALEHNPQLGSAVTGDWTRIGENVGWTRRAHAGDDQLVTRLHQAFMASSDHRANILGNWNRVGVGVVVTDAGKMWVTVNFARYATARPATGQIAEAAAVSRHVFAAAGGSGRRAEYAVLGRADVFADVLGGAALAGDRAPVLFTSGPTAADPDPLLSPTARAEIDRVLGGSGTVYLLGGTSAVSQAAAAELAAGGYDVRRLAGASRVETSVRVASEVAARRGGTGEVLIARADDWADAVSGGAYAARSGSPVLLTGGDRLHPAVAAFLADTRPARRWALGGGAALQEPVVAAAGAQRIAGEDRTGTAVAVAERLWGRTRGTAGDTYAIAPAFTDDGWAYALAHAPRAAADGSPQLLVGDSVSPSVETLLSRLGYSSALRGDVVPASPVPAGVVARLRLLTGN